MLREYCRRKGRNILRDSGPEKSTVDVCILEMSGKLHPWYLSNMVAKTIPEQVQGQ